jgi:hypothetical protein
VLDRALNSWPVRPTRASAIDQLGRGTLDHAGAARRRCRLPAQNSACVGADVQQGLPRPTDGSEKLGSWITAAQQSGQINPELPPELVLYTLFARACDPVLGVLKAGGQYSDEQIIELLLITCFRGLGER